MEPLNIALSSYLTNILVEPGEFVRQHYKNTPRVRSAPDKEPFGTMSSMATQLRFKALSCAALGAVALATPSSARMGTLQEEGVRGQAIAAQGEDGASLVARQPSAMQAAIAKWELLQKDSQLGFFDYSGFALAYPTFPRMEIIRERAENTLAIEAPARADILRFFDAHPPITNAARGRYAMALAAEGRPEAFEVARAAWRGGQMAENVELTIESLYARRFTSLDHAARVDALLWQGDAAGVARQMAKLSPEDRPLALARLAILNGSLPGDAGLDVPEGAYLDAGFLYNLARYHYRERNYDIAASILANRIDVAAPRL
jgi:soluble lytic murein transglycosylase